MLAGKIRLGGKINIAMNQTPKIEELSTEERNPNTLEMDMLPTFELLKTIHRENQSVWEAVENQLPQIAKAVEVIVERFQRGGRLIYVGAGTSGRLATLDASECPPTFGVPFEMVQSVIAGGKEALMRSSEGAEDDRYAGKRDIVERQITECDTVIGIAASGRTPYVIGAMEEASRAGAAVIALVNNSPSEMENHAQIVIAAITGAEALTGSTRLKAGTAQKLILNLLTTASMVKMGKVYSNLMVDVRASNNKLKNRALRIVMAAAEVDAEAAAKALDEANGHCKTAIVMLLLGISAAEAKQRLEETNGFVRQAIQKK